MNCDKKSYQTIIVGLDMTPRYVGNYTMDQIYDFIKYAKGVNPTTTATISEFGNIAVVVHKLFDSNYHRIKNGGLTYEIHRSKL